MRSWFKVPAVALIEVRATDFRRVARVLKGYSASGRVSRARRRPAGGAVLVDFSDSFVNLPGGKRAPLLAGLMRGLIGRFQRIWRPAAGLDHRQALLERLPKGALCAEIGVWKGQFSMRIIATTRPKLLHLVDPWIFQPQFSRRHYGGRTARSQQDMDVIYDEVMNKFGHLSSVKVHRATSKAFFSSNIEDLDWVYIDGDHSTDAVLEDLTMAWQRVKRTGLITGDDYYWSEVADVLPVKMAVDKFCELQRCWKELIGGQYIIGRE